MIGTSDLPMDDPDQAYCTDEEIDYFINMVKIVFPTIPVNRDHIVFTFSGVRPLPASDADYPGQISRDHSIEQTPDVRKLSFPVYNLVGGKWTSFRAFSEETADLVLDHFKLTRKLDTSELAIGGGRGYPRSDCDRENWVKEVSDSYSVAINRIQQLFNRYGTRGESFAEFITLGEDSPLETLPNFSRREVEYICKEEKVVHLDDFFLRRCMLAKLGLLSQTVIEEVAGIFGTVYNLSPEEIQEEVERTIRILKENHGMRL
jgi:glycerol-3-phosphate dehydrogenase